MAQIPRNRRQQIRNELLQKKHVSVRELAEHLDISEATARRDLKALADDGELTLVHGGATLPRQTDFSLQSKQMRNAQAKTIIGQLAAERIADGEQIFLDSGTTCYEVAHHLRQKRSVCVLANSIRLAAALDHPSTEVILLGGKYRAERMDSVGPITLQTLDQMRGYLAFIGADGLSMDFGPSAADVESAHLHRMVIEHAREAIVLADHTKFENASLFRIVPWDAISRIVTDQAPSEEWQQFFHDNAIDLIYPNQTS